MFEDGLIKFLGEVYASKPVRKLAYKRDYTLLCEHCQEEFHKIFRMDDELSFGLVEKGV